MNGWIAVLYLVADVHVRGAALLAAAPLAVLLAVADEHRGNLNKYIAVIYLYPRLCE